MAAASGIWNHSISAVNPLATANATSSPSSNSGSADTSTISANDFLTLLVTEMKNQDPTADTDPNEYINQLVQVNSLEQLIDINQNLSTALGVSGSGSDVGAPAGQAVNPARSPGSSSMSASKSGVQTQTGSKNVGSAHSAAATAVENIRARTTSGNLSVPDPTPAAERVAQALSGRK